MIRADRIYVDSDEGRYYLEIWTEEGDKITVDIQDCVLEFYKNTMDRIGEYAAEAQLVRATMSTADPDDDCGYALDDPKHPTWHDRMVGGA